MPRLRGLAGALLLGACTAAPPPPAPLPLPMVADVPVVVERAPPPLPDPDKLKGKSPADIVVLIGPPGLIRWEGAAQVYQYAGADCVMDLVFYERQPEDGFRLEYIETRDPTGEFADAARCLDGLIQFQATKR